MTDLPTPAGSTISRQGRTRRRFIPRLRGPWKSHFTWESLVVILIMGSFVTTVVSALKIANARKDATNDEDENDNPSSPQNLGVSGDVNVWRLCQIFACTLAGIAAAAMSLSFGVRRGAWFGAAMVLALTFACDVLILPIYTLLNPYWGEFCAMVCVFLLPIIFFFIAIRFRKVAAEAQEQQTIPLS